MFNSKVIEIFRRRVIITDIHQSERKTMNTKELPMSKKSTPYLPLPLFRVFSRKQKDASIFHSKVEVNKVLPVEKEKKFLPN